MNRFNTLIVALLIAFILVGCGNKNGEPPTPKPTPTPEGIEGQILGFWQSAENDEGSCGAWLFDNGKFYDIGIGSGRVGFIGNYNFINADTFVLQDVSQENPPVTIRVFDISDDSATFQSEGDNIIIKVKRLPPLTNTDGELKKQIIGLWRGTREVDGETFTEMIEYANGDSVLMPLYDYSDYLLGYYKVVQRSGMEELYDYESRNINIYRIVEKISDDQMTLYFPCGEKVTYNRIPGFSNLHKDIVGTWHSEINENDDLDNYYAELGWEITFSEDGVVSSPNSQNESYKVISNNTILIGDTVAINVVDMSRNKIVLAFWGEAYSNDDPKLFTYLRGKQ